MSQQIVLHDDKAVSLGKNQPGIFPAVSNKRSRQGCQRNEKMFLRSVVAMNSQNENDWQNITHVTPLIINIGTQNCVILFVILICKRIYWMSLHEILNSVCRCAIRGKKLQDLIKEKITLQMKTPTAAIELNRFETCEKICAYLIDGILTYHCNNRSCM